MGVQRSVTGRFRLHTLRIGIECCFTFASIAQIKFELGNIHDAGRFLTDGEREYSSVLRLIAETQDLSSEVLLELESETIAVRERLDEVKELSRILSNVKAQDWVV